jgi:hypothetical protein
MNDDTIKEKPLSIAKPGAFDLDKFRSTRDPTVAGVETLQTPLPILSAAQAKDFIRLHPDEDAYWTPEYCFVSVPVKGVRRPPLHLIVEGLAERYLQPARIARHRLALASKPYDVFFLCHIPTRNLDNSWVDSNLRGCEAAKTAWVEVTSRGDEGVDAYKITVAHNVDTFPEPKWPTQSLDDLIKVTFGGYMINSEDHPGLLRLRGAKQSVA